MVRLSDILHLQLRNKKESLALKYSSAVTLRFRQCNIAVLLRMHLVLRVPRKSKEFWQIQKGKGDLIEHI